MDEHYIDLAKYRLDKAKSSIEIAKLALANDIMEIVQTVLTMGFLIRRVR